MDDGFERWWQDAGKDQKDRKECAHSAWIVGRSRAYDIVPQKKRNEAVWDVMSDGGWHTIGEVSERTGFEASSVSSQIRDYRKQEYGSFIVERRKTGFMGLMGAYEYRIVK